MNRFLSYLNTFLVAAVIAVGGIGTSSCMREAGIDVERIIPDSAFSIDIEGFNGVPDTKSVLSSGIETKVTTVVLAAYDQSNGRLATTAYYSSSRSSYPMKLLEGHTYNVYSFVNMGDMRSRLSSSEEGNEGVILYDIPSYTGTDGVDSRGIPMYGIKESFVAGTTTDYDIPVKRLFAKVTVNVTVPSGMLVQRVSVGSLNTAMIPVGDSMSDSGITKLSNDVEYETISGVSVSCVLYVPENMQGNCSGIISSSHKNPVDIGWDDDSIACLTYLEIEASGTGSTYEGKVVYRSFLGNNATNNFDIKRNCAYVWNLTYSIDNIEVNNWKIDTDDFTMRKYRYVPDPSSISVNVGASNNVSVLRYEDTFNAGVWTSGTTPTRMTSGTVGVQSINPSDLFSAVSATEGGYCVAKVTGLRAGSGTLGFTYNGEYMTVPVTVNDVITYQYRLTLNPDPLDIMVGETGTFSAVLHTDKYVNGVCETDYAVETLDNTVLDWSIGDTSIAGYTDTRGTFNGIADGRTTVTAYYTVNGSDISCTVPVNVYSYKWRMTLSESSVSLVIDGDYSPYIYYYFWKDKYIGSELYELATEHEDFTGTRISISISDKIDKNGNSLSYSPVLYTSNVDDKQNQRFKLRADSSASTLYSPYTITMKSYPGSTSAGYLYASIQVYVTNNPVTYDYYIDPDPISVSTGNTYQARVYRRTYVNGVLSQTTEINPTYCRWSISEGDSYASVGSGTGIVTGLAAGTAKLQATGNISYTSELYGIYIYATVNVTQTNVTTYRFSISPGSITVGTGNNYTPQVIRKTYLNGSYVSGSDTTMSLSDFNWSSGNSSVVNFPSSAGVIHGVNSGTTTVTATLKTTAADYAMFDNTSATASVTVSLPTYSLVVKPSTKTIGKGQTQAYQAYLVTDGVESTSPLTSGVTWSSSDTSVATISGTGAGTATGVAAGTVTITARYTPSGSSQKTTTATLNVVDYNYVYKNLRVDPDTATIQVSGQQAFAAKITKETWLNGSLISSEEETLTSGVTWSSSNTTVATISGTGAGTATGRAAGTATITARYTPSGSSQLTATASLTVVNQPSVTTYELSITPASASIFLGESTTFTAVLRTITKVNGTVTSDTTENLTSGVTWSSSDTSVATISGTGAGTATGVDIGEVIISAKYTPAGHQQLTATASLIVDFNLNVIVDDDDDNDQNNNY